MKELTYAELLQRNREIEPTLQGRPQRIAVLSNVVVAQLKEILEYPLRSQGVNAQVEIGEYDNVVQDAVRFANYDAVLVFWDPCNFVDGLHWRIALMSKEELSALYERMLGELDLVLEQLAHTPLVLFNRFSTLLFNCYELRQNALDRLCCNLNHRLDEKAGSHLLTVDLNRVIAQVSVARSADWRGFYSVRALYTVEFLRAYSAHALPALLSAAGRARKALILDCDNTLWEGILGEDGEEGIAMSADTRQGRPFAEVQGIAQGLAREGVILGLCSKNNSQDVDRVFDNHPDMKLRKDDLAIKRINWLDKVTNLQEIATTLNIGIDSLAFVDDSDFEIELVREKLPEVATLHVPDARYDYPALMRRARGLFFSLSRTAEDAAKTRMYREEAERKEAARNFSSVEDYLRSLGLKITIYANDAGLVPRMAQLTQKTNQFNLTTKRYTEAELKRMLEDGQNLVVAFRVLDRFGDYGITGLVIVERARGSGRARVDSFLMSCRVLGRNVERALFDWLVKELAARGVRHLHMEYRRTPKNGQVEDFFERFGIPPSKMTDEGKFYELTLDQFPESTIEYIEVESK